MAVVVDKKCKKHSLMIAIYFIRWIYVNISYNISLTPVYLCSASEEKCRLRCSSGLNEKCKTKHFDIPSNWLHDKYFFTCL